jgi:hypothetical protein
MRGAAPTPLDRLFPLCFASAAFVQDHSAWALPRPPARSRCEVEIVAILVGVALLVVGSVEVTRSVLVYGGHGPLSRWLHRGIWRVTRRLALEAPRSWADRLLVGGGPAMLLATIVLWVSLTWLGFAMIYLPGMPELFAHQVVPGEPILDALYFSAVSLSTVGYGDIAARHPALQLVSALEALAGFALLTTALTYILGVYGVLQQQGAVASMIEDLAGGSTDPFDLAESLLRHRDPEVKLDSLHRDLLGHDEGLHRYPIVFYFRSRTHGPSAMYALRMASEAAASLRWALPAGHDVTRSPSLEALLRAQRRVAGEMRDRFLRVHGDTPDGLSDDELRHRFERATGLARDPGTVASGPDDDRQRRYAEWSAFVRDIEDVTLRAASRLALDVTAVHPTAHADHPRPATGPPGDSSDGPHPGGSS